MNQNQIENILNQRLADLERKIKDDLRAEFSGLRSTRKNSSGHKKAGESWERSVKGSKWKAELEAAKEELKRIIGQRTGKDEYANQQLVTKYASAKRKGDQEEMRRIVEDVIANAQGEAVMIAPTTPNMTRRNNRNNNRNNNRINRGANANMNRLMNSTFVALPQKPVTPVPVAAPPAAPQALEEPNEFNLTEPFTYTDA
jgi:hypothetical protein